MRCRLEVGGWEGKEHSEQFGLDARRLARKKDGSDRRMPLHCAALRRLTRCFLRRAQPRAQAPASVALALARALPLRGQAAASRSRSATRAPKPSTRKSRRAPHAFTRQQRRERLSDAAAGRPMRDQFTKKS